MNREKSSISICGISGRFPRSRNLKEFAKNLYEKVDMIDDEESRWKHFDPLISKRIGKVSDLEKFDASFFFYMDKHANITDPQTRMLLEHCYESIIDAGVNPQALFGKRIGVFVASMMLDAKDGFLNSVPLKHGDGGTFVTNALFNIANRISFVFGFTGPSFSLDTACSGSAYALNCAKLSIEAGECDAALVAGTSLILSQLDMVEMTRRGVLTLNGLSKPFDENGTGYVRAETIGAFFLQKSSEAKRIYAEIVHTKVNNDGFKHEGVNFPSAKMQKQLMEDFYREIDVNPNQISYVEAHSAGTKVGDAQEVNAIDELFFHDQTREKLWIGSVKANMGHAEAAAAFASMAKILIAFENSKIPPTINLENSRKDVKAFAENRIEVVTEPMEFDGDYIALNSFGLGGANAHVLLKRNKKTKTQVEVPQDDLPRLIVWSGRTETAVNEIFNDIVQRPFDHEYIALLHSCQTQTSVQNNFRGFAVLNREHFENSKDFKTEVSPFDGTRCPVVWVYTGMGSQWVGMISDLMKIPKFADSIDKSHNFLMTKNVNLKSIFGSAVKSLFENVQNSYVSIIAIEIAITDVLKSLGIVPDFIIGHSVGELGCAYADGCLTAEETINIAYLRGQVGLQFNSVKGSMAAVGLHHSQLKSMIPHDIDIACHNAKSSTTISGPSESVQAFVKKLTDEKIFAKSVDSSNVAFHSRYVQEMGKHFHDLLQTVIEVPKKRSPKWLSSTFPKSMWNETECKYASADYHVSNLLNPVLFEEVCQMLPQNSLVIEIGPHGLLKSILKQNISKAKVFSMMERGNRDGSLYFLETLGRLFSSGIDMNLLELYPKIDFPVSRGTPMISPLIKWKHDVDYFVPYYDSKSRNARRSTVINLSNPKFKFLEGHVVNGKIVIPGAFWIYLVWECFSFFVGEPKEKLKIVFSDVKFTRATTLDENHDVVASTTIHEGTGKFEVIEGQSIVCEGYIKHDPDFTLTELDILKLKDFKASFTEDEHYKIFSLEGIKFTGEFRHMSEMNVDDWIGKLRWNWNWVTFIDGIIANGTDLIKSSFVVPTKIRQIFIDPKVHFEMLKGLTHGESTTMMLQSFQDSKIARAGGVEIRSFEFSSFGTPRSQSATLEVYKFVPYFPIQTYTLAEVARIFLQLMYENNPKTLFDVLEIDSGSDFGFLLSYFLIAVQLQPQIELDATILTKNESAREDGIKVSSSDLSSFKDIDVLIKANATEDEGLLNSAAHVLHERGFVISIDESQKIIEKSGFITVSSIFVGSHFINLLKLKPNQEPLHYQLVNKISRNVDEWIGSMKNNLVAGANIALGDKNLSGVVGFVKCIRKEPFGEDVRCFCIKDEQAENFSQDDDFYKSQINKNLVMNVLKKGEWGSYRHLDLPNYIPNHFKTHCYVDCLKPGDASTITWLQGPFDVASDSQNLIKVAFAALNSKDLLKTQSPKRQRYQLSSIGSEFSGLNSQNQRVMGISKVLEAMATHCSASESRCWNVPEKWTLEEAATVPLAYFTVYFAFFKETTIKSGQSVLIHNGTDDIGLAAIHVALSYGLKVFTTVGSSTKKKYLLEKFPELTDDCIGDSKSDKFERMVMQKTNGGGVDIVLNSLNGDLMQASLRCVKAFGTFLEIEPVQTETKIELEYLMKRINIKAVIINDHSTNEDDNKFVHEIMDRDLKSGIIKPLQSTVFEASDVQEAFAYMAKSRHVGKILLKIRQTENLLLPLPIDPLPRFYSQNGEVQIIVGGLGGFGMELTSWLIARGCTKVVLCSRRGVTNGYQKFRIDQWKSKGVQISVSQADVTTRAGCEELISTALQIGSVAGIFNLAVVLRDKMFENQTAKSFNECLEPKAEVTQLLDEISRVKCPRLKNFVLFSSVVSGRGNAGQTNYGMANSIMEEIIEKRHEAGLPAKAIQWGAIQDVGLLENIGENVEICGTSGQEISSCFEVLDTLLMSPESIVSSMILAKKRKSKCKRTDLIMVLLNALKLEKSVQNLETPLAKLGIDSFVTVEIQLILERDFQSSISSGLLRNLTINQIKERVESPKTAELMLYDISIVRDSKALKTMFGDENASKTILKANDIEDESLPKILIIPGIIGSAGEIFFKLASNLNYPSYILSYHKSAKCVNFHDMVEILWEDVKEFYEKNENFIIVSASFGSAICLIFTEKLEALGKKGQIMFIDGSPMWSFKLSKQLSNSNEVGRNVIEDFTLNFFIKIAFLGESKEIIKKVSEETSWKDKVKKLYKMTQSHFNFSYEYFEVYIIKAMTNRIMMIQMFDQISFPILESKMVLLKASEPSVKDLDENYGLDCSKQPLVIRTIEGSHVSILNNPGLPKIINSLL